MVRPPGTATECGGLGAWGCGQGELASDGCPGHPWSHCRARTVGGRKSPDLGVGRAGLESLSSVEDLLGDLGSHLASL